MKPSEPDTNNCFDEYFKQKLASAEVDASLAEAAWQRMQLPVNKKPSTGFWLIAVALLALLTGSIYFMWHNNILPEITTAEKKISKDAKQQETDSKSTFNKQTARQHIQTVRTNTVTPATNKKRSDSQKETLLQLADTILLTMPAGLQSLPVSNQQSAADSNAFSINNKRDHTIDSNLVITHLSAEKKKDSTIKKVPSIIW